MFHLRKIKCARYNNQKFMTKILRKALMVRSRLRNNLNLNKSNYNWQKYKTQRNLCVKIF